MTNFSIFALKYRSESTHFSVSVQTLFQNRNYTLLNISAELHSLFSRFPVRFQKIYTENFSNLLSAQICSALSLPEQCAEKVTTVRWKYQNLVDWRKELFAKDK